MDIDRTAADFKALFIGVVVLAFIACGGPSQPTVYTSLIPAVLGNDLKEVQRLVIEEKVDVNLRTGGVGSPALESAAYADQTEIMSFLLAHGADPNLGEARNRTPLHAASYGGHLASVQLLLKAGALVDPIEETTRSTPLIVAALKGHRSVVVALLAAGADVTLRDVGGETAEDKAKRFGHTDVAGVLEAARVDLERKKRELSG